LVKDTLKGLALKPKGRQHMDIERRIKAKEREAEARAKALERRIKVRERAADTRRKAYEDEMREVEGEEGGRGLIEQSSH
jgi:hypothetical protein